jgi:tetratricopeptide (TPR) repeat protein
MKIYIISICLMLGTIISCHSQEKKDLKNDKIAQALNDTAILLFQKYNYQEDSLKKAIQLLEKAIKVDSTYAIAYSNKVSILCSLGDCQAALRTLEKLITFKKTNPTVFIIEGHILEKTGDIDKAIQKYKTADSLYDVQIESKTNVTQNKLGKAYLQLFLKGKEDATIAFNKIKKDVPSQDAELMTETIYDFDRDKFISEFCSCSPSNSKIGQ